MFLGICVSVCVGQSGMLLLYVSTNSVNSFVSFDVLVSCYFIFHLIKI